MKRIAGFALSILIGSAVVVSSRPQVEATATNGTNTREFVISVLQQPNPLSVVAARTSELLSIAVSYEEPAWRSDAELMRYVDTPDIQARPPEVIARVDPKLKAGLVGTVEAKASLQAGQNEVQLAGQLLQESIDDHAKRGNPGRFKLVRVDNYGYSIVPTHVRGKNGEWVSVSSPLDVRISFPRQKRTLGYTLLMITQAASRKAGESLEPDIYNGPGLYSIYDVSDATIGANNEIARDVLARALREMRVHGGSDPSPVMTWQLVRRLNKDSLLHSNYALRFEGIPHRNLEGRPLLYWPSTEGK